MDEFEDMAKHVLVYYDMEPVGTGRVRIVEGKAGENLRIILVQFLTLIWLRIYLVKYYYN
ncbi:hypothetical protein PAAL109150_15175 [Paenibacillus alkaliterrae]|uniref:hypothetical protein n=1 Tax=Paenibacillus alkaliterrae TaxID=320909 RepID=UPI002E241695